MNSSTFSLRGTGLPAAPLPPVSITTSGGVPELLQQIPVALTLSAPYDIDLIGSLTVAPEAVGSSLDPSVQFSTGGRSVAFVVPAGSKHARFTNGLETVRVQTGSVAGTILLGATLATTAKADVTPSEAPSLRLTLPRTLPKLIHGSVELGQDNSFTLRVAGIAPGRSLARLRCQLVPTGRVKLGSEKLEFDISLLSSSWFRSSQAAEFGGTFGVSVPLRMNLSAVDPKSTLKISDVIHAIVVVLEDDLGASNEVRVSLE